MKTTDIIRRAGGNLRRAKSRTLLTAVAISVGGFAIVVSMAAGEGARQYVDRVISANMDKQSLTIVKDKRLVEVTSAESFAGGLTEYNPDKMMASGIDIVSLNSEDVTKLKQRSEFVSVEPMYTVKSKFLTFSADKDQKYTTDVLAYDSSVVSQTAAGELPSLHEQLEDDQAVIPKSFAKTLKVSAKDAIGTTVTVRVSQPPQELSGDDIQEAYIKGGESAVEKLTEGKTMDKTFKIAAVTQSSVNELDQQSGLFISNNVAKQLSDFSTEGTEQHGKYMMAMAIVKPDLKPEDVKNSLKKDGFYAATAEDLQQMLFTFVNILQSIVLGFGILALIVSIFGIINTQYISVLERTQQIGLMKALGASRRDVARLFRYEAAWVGFLGGVIGSLAAWGAGIIANPIITDKLNLGEGNHLLVFQLLPAAIVVLLLVVVAILSGWLPSRKAARLDPIKALRTD